MEIPDFGFHPSIVCIPNIIDVSYREKIQYNVSKKKTEYTSIDHMRLEFSWAIGNFSRSGE